MKLFVGLGNPGRDYALHRHNVGFMAVDRIHDAHEFSPWKSRFQGAVSDGRIAGNRVLLLKPETYMNESGRSVSAAARYLKIAPENVVVFYDEIDLAPGKLKVKTGGGNAGHNGLRSITQHFGNEYQRVRIGVGHPGQKSEVANYVLSNFAKADQAWLDPLLEAMAREAGLLASGTGERFLSTVVQAITPEPAQRSKQAPKAKPASANDAAPAAKPDAQEKPAAQDKAPGSALSEGLKSWFRKGKPDADG